MHSEAVALLFPDVSRLGKALPTKTTAVTSQAPPPPARLLLLAFRRQDVLLCLIPEKERSPEDFPISSWCFANLFADMEFSKIVLYYCK